MERQLVFFMDFDGTVTYQDVGYAMVQRFASTGWYELNQRWEAGELSTGQCAQKTLDLMMVKPEELEDFFLSQQLSPGFLDFIVWLKGFHFPYFIVSDGYDNYIKPILKKYGLEIPYYANHLEYRQGWVFNSLHSNPYCEKCGTCKSQIVKLNCPQEALSVYVGDGYSDRCAAGLCDIVLAKKALAQHCRQQNIPYHSFEDFYDVKKILENLLDLGERRIV